MTSTSDAALVALLRLQTNAHIKEGNIARAANCEQAAARIEALSKVEGELAKLRQAITDKGGSEHAPTQWAYDKACEALHKSGDREASLRAQLDAMGRRVKAERDRCALGSSSFDLGRVCSLEWVMEIIDAG